MEAYTWPVNFPLPEALCAREPALQKYGFIRRLNDDRCPKNIKPPCYQYVSICKPTSGEFIGVYKPDFEKIMNELFPKPQEDR